MRKYKLSAFTFIELILVVIILSVLAAVSVPNLKRSFRNLELNNFSSSLQAFMGYLSQKATTEEKILYLKFDNSGKEYRVEAADEPGKQERYKIPGGLSVETEQEKIAFYPDGTIDKVNIILKNQEDKTITLTTKGVYSGVKAKN